jgi:hypothetical protein
LFSGLPLTLEPFHFAISPLKIPLEFCLKIKLQRTKIKCSKHILPRQAGFLLWKAPAGDFSYNK